jgi:hypothetical protein
MIHRLEIYLDQVMTYAGLPPHEAIKARNELADHLLTRIAELEAQGATRDDAAYRAIHEHGRAWQVGYRLRPSFPWMDVRLKGTARGVFAVGPRAIGVVSCGVISTGVVSCGVVSLGIVSLGVITGALLLGLGVISAGLIALGVNALGFVAAGLNSVGVLTAGLNTVGLWVFNGTNSLSYFDERTVPHWLQEVGFSISWNTGETIIAFVPLLFLWTALIAVATVCATGERRRLGEGIARRSVPS